MKPPLSPIERLMRRREIDEDGCWLLKGTPTSSGHMSIRVKIDGRWRTMSAHKFSYLHHHGPLPKDEHGRDYHVRHRCDKRRCWNPDCLLPGTRSNNMKDMIERNRGRRQFSSVYQPKDNSCPF